MKRTLITVVALSIGAAFGSPTTADEHAYVTASSLNCRANPSTASKVVEKLAQGDPAPVQARQEAWAKVTSISGRTCWVSSEHLSEESSYQAYSSARSVKSSRVKASKSKRPSKHQSFSLARKRRSPAPFYGDSCPCSGSRVCIGPRGGRYCITSGGNKRYGV